MTDGRELRIPHGEVTLVAFRCREDKCGAELTFDLSKETLPVALKCPFCSSEFNSLVLDGLKRLKDWKLFCAQSGHEIVLRIPIKSS